MFLTVIRMAVIASVKANIDSKIVDEFLFSFFMKIYMTKLFSTVISAVRVHCVYMVIGRATNMIHGDSPFKQPGIIRTQVKFVESK